MSDMQGIIGEPVELPKDPAPQEQPIANEAPAAPAPQEAPQEQPAEPKTVPLAALNEERTRRREIAAELAAERRAREEMERRMEQRLAQLHQAVVPPTPPVPSLDENPAAHLAHGQNELRQTVTQLVQQSQQEREAAQRAQAQAQLAARVQADEATFKAKTPDYEDAVRHMHELRVRELQALGLDDLSASQKSAAELSEFAFVTAMQGRSPAQVAYELAKVRGYTAKAPTPSPQEQIQTAQKGAAAAQSLGGGGSTGGRLTARQLLSMSDDEFAAATAGDKWQKLMGTT